MTLQGVKTKTMITQTKETQSKITPQEALNMLLEGNRRFVQSKKMLRDLKRQVKETSEGQYPYAVILGCIDSRVPLSQVFDQGIGDIFGVRLAGNVVNEDALGSMEYACKVAGSKLVLVLGHTRCGAVTSACKGVELGNITALLNKIKPAVERVKAQKGEADVEEVAIENVRLSMERIRNESPILAEMEKNGEIMIVGAVYDTATGEVSLI